MKNHVLSSLVSVLFFGFATAAWADVTIPGDAFPAQLTGDVKIDGCGKVTVSDRIDLNGHRLTLNGISGLLGTGTITDTTTEEASPGELHLGVTTDFSASTVSLSGNLRLVKEGVKTLTMAYSAAAYTGGNVVNAGTLKIGTTSHTIANFKPLGAKGCEIVVNKGGTLDVNGKYNFKDVYAITLNGGTLANTGKRSNISSNPFNAEITLTANSTFGTSDEYNYAGKLNLKGYTLTLNLSNILHWGPSAVDAGTIVLGGTKNLQLEKDVDLSRVSFQVGGLLNLQTYTLKVKDYVANVATYSGTGALQVSGVFTPASDNFYPPTMMDRSIINLSGKVEAWSLANTKFADGATVTIALGDRALEANQKIVEWVEKPEGVTFVYTGDNIGGKSFTETSSGIFFDAADDAVVSATWTGAGAAGDWTDAANWDCRNASGEPLSKAPPTDLTVRFTGAVSGLALDAGFPFAGAQFDAVELAAPADWTGLDFDLVTDDSSIDLKGHALTVTGGQDWLATKPVTFTDTVGNGALELTVAEGLVVTNAAPVLTGALKLVKTGAGSYVAKKNQAYTGVTEIAAGSVVCETADYSSKATFGAAKAIKVDAGAVLDPAGSWNWTGYTIELDGGSISNTVGEGANNNQRNFNPALVLNDESTFYVGGNQNYNFLGTLTANGHVLNVEIDNSKYLTWEPSATDAVTVRVNRGGGFRTLNNVRELPNMTLEMKGAALDVGKSLTVKDYTAAYNWNENGGTAELKVCETFTPACDYFYGCTLQDGATIDLSAKTAVWSVTSAFSKGSKTVKFAEGAIVTLSLGERTEGVAIGDTLVSWPEGTPYEGRVFLLTGTAAEGKALSASATGLTIVEADDSVHTAVWTGAAGDGNFANAANWSCQTIAGVSVEGVPEEGSIVRIPAAALATLDCPAGADFAYAVLQIVSESGADPVVLTGDRDWRGFGGIDITFPIDLKGHDLKVALDGVSSVATLVTNSVEAVASTLAVTVAEGETYNNTQVTIGGNLTLVKEGTGTFVAARTPQTYTGETVVNAGTLRAADSANVNKDSTASVTNSPFGGSRVITVGPEGVLDPRGSSAWGYHTINLNGGAITNTVAKRGVGTTAYNVAASNYPEPFNPTINLLADSTFATTKEFNFNGKIVSDGHDLEIWIASGQSLLWVPKAAEKAVFNVTNGGYLKTLKNHTFNQKTATLKFTGGTMDLAGDLVVSNYYVATAVKDYQYDARAELKMTVAGVFTPVTQNFFGCQLLDGATIDLGNQKTSWSSHSALVNSHKSTMGQGDCLDVTFADGATVTIDVGEREFKGVEQIVAWSEGSKTSAAGATFDLNAAAKAKGYCLTRDADGLSVGRKGLVLIFQ